MTEKSVSNPNLRPGTEGPAIDARKRLWLKSGLAGCVALAGCGGGGGGVGGFGTGFGSGTSAAGAGSAAGDVATESPAPVDGGIPSPEPGASTPANNVRVGSRAPVSPVRYTVSGRQILRNGQRFIAKGMCYAPQPIGASFDSEPWGDFFSDFWRPIFARDISNMKAMGVNSIRLYSTLPFRFIYDATSARLQHKLFLDACNTAGINVWAGFPIDGGVYEASDPDQLARTRRGVELLSQEMGSHPAVIGFVVGNEANLGAPRRAAPAGPAIRDDPGFWSWINDLAGVCKANAPTKLTMTCLIDDGMLSVRSAGNAPDTRNVDVFGINAYRGSVDTGFGSLFTEYQALSDRPLLITEFGCPASRRRPEDGSIDELPDRAAAQAAYIATQWKDIARPENQSVVSGGYVFAWTDEWWKLGSPTVHSAHDGGFAGNFPGGYGDEEWFGIHSIALDPRRESQPDRPVNDQGVHYPDILTPRAAADTLTQLWNP